MLPLYRRRNTPARDHRSYSRKAGQRSTVYRAASPKFHDAGNVKLDIVNHYPSQDRSTAVKRFDAGELDSNDDFPTEQLAGLSPPQTCGAR